MKLPDSILSLFTSTVVENDGDYYVKIPESEVSNGVIEPGDLVKVGLYNTESGSQTEFTKPIEDNQSARRFSGDDGQRMVPPVDEGDELTVEIQDIGKKGDGIALVDGGFVLIVPDTSVNDTVTVEVTDVKESFAIAEPREFQEPVATHQ